jgi:hypothetical protein
MYIKEQGNTILLLLKGGHQKNCPQKKRLFTVILQCNIEVFQLHVLTVIYSMISVLLISAKIKKTLLWPDDLYDAIK